MHGFTPLFARLEWITLSHNMGTRTTQEGPPESVLARSFPLSPHPRQKRPGVLSTAGTKKKRMFRYKLSMPLAVKCPGCGTEPSRSALEERLYICPGCNRHLTMPSQIRAETLADPGTCHEFDRGLVSVGVHWRGLVRSAIGNAFGVVAGLLRGTAPRQGSTQALNPMKPVRAGDS